MVTVLMAVYDPPLGMLAQAIDSVLAQSWRDFEFLILDDGSRLHSVREYLSRRAERDDRVRLMCEPHRGLTATLNRGIELARGKWIARQDADDWSEPARLERQMAKVTGSDPVAACGTQAWIHQEDGRALWRTRLPRRHSEILAAFPKGNPFVHGSVIFHKDAVREIGGYREVFRCAQDYDLFWRLAERHAVVNLDEPLYHYRHTDSSVSTARATEQVTAHRAIQKLAAARRRGEPEDPESALAEAASEASVYRAMLKQADHLMLAGNYRRAARAYADLLAEHPASPMAWAKLARLGVFRVAPFLRQACFR